MANLDEILGNEQLKKHFRTSVRQNKVSHAYVIEGEKGSGKKLLSAAFAKILQCEKRGEGEPDACGRCQSCIQADNKNHPDIIWVSHEKTNVISVGEVREQIVNTIDIMPYRGPYKIYIVDEAEKMNPAAQNAILKTIEEPPNYGIIFLLTTNKGAFLPTILSRCIILAVKPVSEEIIKKYLMEQLNVPGAAADFCAGFSMGNVGKAMDAVLSEDFLEMRNFCISVLQYIQESESFEITEYVKKLKQKKDFSDEYLDMMIMWFRDVLLLKVRGEKKLIFQEEYSYIKKQGDNISFEGLNKIFYEIEQARARLRSNVNFEAVLEIMFIKIRDSFRKNRK